MTLDESWRTAGADPFALEDHSSVTNPVIINTHVTGLGTIVYVADPFIVLDGETYYMFYEAQKPGLITTIVYSTSADGLAWTFGAQVLSATETGSSALSYPQVLKVDDDWYMFVTSSNDEIGLWRATTFPTAWEKVQPLVTGNWGPRDGTIFQYGGVFYIIVYDTTNVTTRLYYSDTLYGTGAWTEHSQSPILSGQRNSRPAGRPIVRASSVDIFVQDNVAEYGNKTRIYKLTELTKTTVTATELVGSPITEGDGVGWNSDGMHTLDRVSDALTVVDGKDASGVWTIGIYKDTA